MGDLCRGGFLLTTAISKKDPNLQTAPTGQQVETGNGQREEPTANNGIEPSSEQEQKPASQSMYQEER